MEYTIVSDGTLPVIVPKRTGTSPQGDKEGYYFNPDITSTSWELNNLLIGAELVANNISSHILSGNSLKMCFPMYHTITQTFPKTFGEINMNIVKSASKLSGALHCIAHHAQAMTLVDTYQTIMVLRDGITSTIQ